jgi:hypothetical protein
MARKWKTVVIIWIGILLYFGIGSFHPRDADLLLIIFYSVLLLAATVYTVVIWVRDQAKREPEKSYHLSAYPRGFLRFAFDKGERKQERRVERQPEKLQKSDADHS